MAGEINPLTYHDVFEKQINRKGAKALRKRK